MRPPSTFITAPVTMEGTLVVQNAEILSGITLTQLVREGAPVIFAGSSSATAMRYGTLSIGAPEMAVNTAATAQMARYYNLPSRSGGAVCDAKMPDAQAAYEESTTPTNCGDGSHDTRADSFQPFAGDRRRKT